MRINELMLGHARVMQNHNPSGEVRDFRELPRPFSSIALVSSGMLEFITDGFTETVGAGELIFVPYGATYTLHCLEDADYISLYLSLDYFSGRRGKYRIQRLGRDIGDILSEDFALLAGKLSSQSLLSSDKLDFSALAHIYAILAKLEPRLDVTEVKKPDPRIAAALEFIETRPTEPIRIPELAAQCRLSESHFYALFSSATGMTPIEYKNRIAVRLAERLLYENELSIEEISGRTGFMSSSYFRRVFRSVLGMSPREYKKRILELGQS